VNAKQITIPSLEFFHSILRGFRHHEGAGVWFRGQSDSSWSLLPKAGRSSHYLPDNRDLGRFNAWRHDAYPYLDVDIQRDFEMLAYAQHHGLATRLLDWTANPLVAAYFSVSADADKDGLIFCYSPEVFVDLETAKIRQDGLHGAGLITPAFDGRMLNQKGLFTVHSPPDASLEVQPISFMPEEPNLHILVIPAELKEDLRLQLGDYGITEHFIFPDVDGVARHINADTELMAKKSAQQGAAPNRLTHSESDFSDD